jgi:hypothetical protein
MQPFRKWPMRLALLLILALNEGCRNAGVASGVLRLNPTFGTRYQYSVDLRSRAIAGPNLKTEETIIFQSKDDQGFHGTFTLSSKGPFNFTTDGLGQFRPEGVERLMSSPGNALDGLLLPADSIRSGYTWWSTTPLSEVSPNLVSIPDAFKKMPLPLRNRVTRINLKTVRIDTAASKRFFAPPPSHDVLDLNLDAKTYINEEDGMLVMSVTQISVQIYGKKTVDGHLEAIITRQSD